jgi:hypothetical protein
LFREEIVHYRTVSAVRIGAQVPYVVIDILLLIVALVVLSPRARPRHPLVGNVGRMLLGEMRGFQF